MFCGLPHYSSVWGGFLSSCVSWGLNAPGVSEGEFAATSETARLQYANGFFSGGHDLIIGRR